MNYRFDHRSKEQFTKDIKESSIIERELLNKWLDLIEKQTGKRPNHVYIGSGQNGEYLEKNDVTTKADFRVEGYGLVEVKFSKFKFKKYFHLKISQIKHYIEQKASILMISGVDTEDMEYVLLKVKHLEKIQNICKIVNCYGFGGKLSYRILMTDFIWRKL